MKIKKNCLDKDSLVICAWQLEDGFGVKCSARKTSKEQERRERDRGTGEKRNIHTPVHCLRLGINKSIALGYARRHGDCGAVETQLRSPLTLIPEEREIYRDERAREHARPSPLVASSPLLSSAMVPVVAALKSCRHNPYGRSSIRAHQLFFFSSGFFFFHIYIYIYRYMLKISRIFNLWCYYVLIILFNYYFVSKNGRKLSFCFKGLHGLWNWKIDFFHNLGGDRNFERPNVEWQIFRNLRG